MISDNERRDVARRLRMSRSEWSGMGWKLWLGPKFGAVVLSDGNRDELEDAAHRLTDLIEPNRGSGGRSILCAHCESASWCGCEPGDDEGGCDFTQNITEGEPPYNLYSLYEAVFRRHPRDKYAIEDDEVDELVDALLDICNSPGHEHIQRPQPSCDRDALLELADELSGDTLTVPAVYGTYMGGYVAACRDAARRIREALGESDG